MRARERIYIVPCPAGLVFAISVFLVFAAGFLSTGFSGSTQPLVIALLVAGIVALIETNENLRGVEITDWRCEDGPADCDGVLEVTLANRSVHERLGLKIRVREGWSFPVLGEIRTLEAFGSTQVRIPLPPAKRGVHPIPALWITSSQPFGLCFAWKVFRDAGCRFVYPRPLGLPIGLMSSHPRGTQTDRAGNFGDVSGHSPYSTGDPPSRLDWKVYARRGKLVVKSLEGAEGGGILLRWADTAFIHDHEKRLEQLSFWVCECLRTSIPFVLDLGPPSPHLTHRRPSECRRALASFPAGP